MSKWIKSGDPVQVIAGNDRGARGKVVSKKGDRVIVEGVQKRVRHLSAKKSPQLHGRISVEMPVHISNVVMVDAEGTPIRPKAVTRADGSRDLVYERDGEQVVLRQLRKAVAVAGGNA